MIGLLPKQISFTRVTKYEDSEYFQKFELNKPKKVILLLLDSLREDFVEISDPTLRHLRLENSKYTSKKI